MLSNRRSLKDVCAPGRHWLLGFRYIERAGRIEPGAVCHGQMRDALHANGAYVTRCGSEEFRNHLVTSAGDKDSQELVECIPVSLA
ncbi:hypothetical protein BDZ89DRAFT_1057738 [Hymenopellis radicata]|nr:hypothetical protein BDZ89DRAFT_1057738 [Hymenopellis radicata]